MDPFLAPITSRVNTVMSNANGYDAADRAKMITFLDITIIALVPPLNPFGQFYTAIQDAIRANTTGNYGEAVGTFKQTIQDLCEYTVNLAISYYATGAGGNLVLMGNISETGPFEPTFDDTANLVNNTGEIPNWLRSIAGVYTLTWGTTHPFTNASRIMVIIVQNRVDFTFIYSSKLVADNQLEIKTAGITADIGTGEITGTLSDDMLRNSTLYILYFPA